MNRIARFEKVSKEKFFEGWKDKTKTLDKKNCSFSKAFDM